VSGTCAQERAAGTDRRLWPARPAPPPTARKARRWSAIVAGRSIRQDRFKRSPGRAAAAGAQRSVLEAWAQATEVKRKTPEIGSSGARTSVRRRPGYSSSVARLQSRLRFARRKEYRTPNRLDFSERNVRQGSPCSFAFVVRISPENSRQGLTFGFIEGGPSHLGSFGSKTRSV
jgi:hypothetical protein